MAIEECRHPQPLLLHEFRPAPLMQHFHAWQQTGQLVAGCRRMRNIRAGQQHGRQRAVPREIPVDTEHEIRTPHVLPEGGDFRFIQVRPLGALLGTPFDVAFREVVGMFRVYTNRIL